MLQFAASMVVVCGILWSRLFSCLHAHALNALAVGRLTRCIDPAAKFSKTRRKPLPGPSWILLTSTAVGLFTGAIAKALKD